MYISLIAGTFRTNPRNSFIVKEKKSEKGKIADRAKLFPEIFFIGSIYT